MKARAWFEPGAGLILLVLLALPWARHGMEATMWRQMLIQFPSWLIVGGLLAGAPLERWRPTLRAWNAHGVAGLTAASVVLGILMVPRVLDLALYRPEVEVAKLASLLWAGAALRVSFRPAGVILQSFFLGGILAMMATVGLLYQELPQRLCNAYLLDDQVRLGESLTGFAGLIAVAWMIHAGRVLSREGRERDAPIVAPEARR